MAVVPGCKTLAKLVKAIGAPPQTRRIVIDVAVDDVVRIYYESFATEQQMDDAADATRDIMEGEPGCVIVEQVDRVNVQTPGGQIVVGAESLQYNKVERS